MKTDQRNQHFRPQKKANDYNNLLSTEEWQVKRRTILRRDENRCRNCGGQVELQVHHRQYQKDKTSGEFNKPWEYNDRYLITLCQACHKNGHKNFTIPIFNI